MVSGHFEDTAEGKSQEKVSAAHATNGQAQGKEVQVMDHLEKLGAVAEKGDDEPQDDSPRDKKEDDLLGLMVGGFQFKSFLLWGTLLLKYRSCF
jgi:hypothetical protein